MYPSPFSSLIRALYLLTSSIEDLIVNCIRSKLSEYSDRITHLLMLLAKNSNEFRWSSPEWQQAKHYIGEVIAKCICQLTSCSVYQLDMHGGEPSDGLGDKDIDLAIRCPSNDALDIQKLETIVEEAVTNYLSGVLSYNIYQFLSVPNIVELHNADEFLIKRYIVAGPPYATRLC